MLKLTLEVSIDKDKIVALYIRHKEGTIVETETSKEGIIDYDEKGNVLGIEFLSPCCDRLAKAIFLFDKTAKKC